MGGRGHARNGGGKAARADAHLAARAIFYSRAILPHVSLYANLGWGMELGLRAGAAVRRAVRSVAAVAGRRRPSRGWAKPPPRPIFSTVGASRNSTASSGCCRPRPSPRQESARRRLGVGADRVLIAAGRLSEEAYLRALGDHLGVAFEPLDGVARALCPVDDDALTEAARPGCCRSPTATISRWWWRRAGGRCAGSSPCCKAIPS